MDSTLQTPTIRKSDSSEEQLSSSCASQHVNKDLVVGRERDIWGPLLELLLPQPDPDRR